MKKKTIKFKIIDILLILGIILPLVIAMVIKILITPAAEGVTLTGPNIFVIIPMPFQPLYINESVINSFCVIISILFICLYLTHGISEKPQTKRQLLVEWIYSKVKSLVKDNMGDAFSVFGPFVAAILSLSALSSLMSMLGLFPPTSDLNITAGWAILVFILITYYKFKCGPVYYIKGFCQPVAFLAPINFISEFATPVSMAFRHYGNILSGVVVSLLISTGLTELSDLLFGWVSGVLGGVPFLRVGVPAVFSIYFDVFSGCLQAFIFAMLTMMYVSGAFDADEFTRRRMIKLQKQNKNK